MLFIRYLNQTQLRSCVFHSLILLSDLPVELREERRKYARAIVNG